jgi:UDP-2,3-diacylglucosamine pyrophosphatase LpxH
MNEGESRQEQRLRGVYERAVPRAIGDEDRYVFISDLHLGDGGKNDDARENASIIEDALSSFYYPRGYTLVLNGDIEELLRTRPQAIRKSWYSFFEILDLFAREGRLVRLIGNHEMRSDDDEGAHLDPPAIEALRLDRGKDQHLFVLHGHQAGVVNSGRFNWLIAFLLRNFANRLRISNHSVAHDSEKKMRIEKAVYDFSRSRGIISIIGHTHRPLFESLTREETYGYRIERLCRAYGKASESEKERIKARIDVCKRFMESSRRRKRRERHLAELVYDDELLIPCLFNSGCGIGKRGLTAIEIREGWIFLVHWSDARRSARYRAYRDASITSVVGGGSYRFVYRREPLDYIFARIELLR